MAVAIASSLTQQRAMVTNFSPYDGDTSAANLRRYDRLDAQDLLRIIGLAIQNDPLETGSPAAQLPESMAKRSALIWMQYHARNLVGELADLGVSCSRFSLVVRQMDTERTYARLSHVGWVPAPLAITAYVLRHALDCPVLGRFITRR